MEVKVWVLKQLEKTKDNNELDKMSWDELWKCLYISMLFALNALLNAPYCCSLLHNESAVFSYFFTLYFWINKQQASFVAHKGLSHSEGYAEIVRRACSLVATLVQLIADYTRVIEKHFSPIRHAFRSLFFVFRKSLADALQLHGSVYFTQQELELSQPWRCVQT